jgi:glucose-1-phosphate cytidylyltransferase
MTRVIILAGGLGTRLSEETVSKPKPMVEIGDKPILWHLMNVFGTQGLNQFVIALGYKGDVIKAWLRDLQQLEGDITFDFTNRSTAQTAPDVHAKWQVDAIETGLNSSTSARIAQCMDQFPGERVIVTYGDGLANVNINKLLLFHERHGKIATMTAVRPPARFGKLSLENDRIVKFEEKNQLDEGWINGGFFVLESGVRKYLNEEDVSFEYSSLPKVAQDSELMAYKHEGFWKPMDTLREKREFDEVARQTMTPWLNFNS